MILDRLLMLVSYLAIVALVAHCLASSKQRSIRLLALAAVVLVTLLWPPPVYLLNRVLECGYEQGYPRDRQVGAIVVLAGTVYSPEVERPMLLVASDTYERCVYAAWLYRQWQQLPILACGGPDGDAGDPIMAEAMRDVLAGAGVPPGRIWVEGRSLNTYQNAIYAADILRARGIHRIALVTEAYHMRRAEGCFRKQGLEVVPAPCGFRSRYRFRPAKFLPSAFNLDQGVDAVHECFGLGWYWLNGRLSYAAPGQMAGAVK